MELYLIRHAEAHPIGEGGAATDDDRPLTELGRRQAAAVGAWLLGRKVKPGRLVVSPLTRAVQTAEYVRDALGVPEDLWEEGLDFVPAGKPREMAATLDTVRTGQVVVVGHEPSLSGLAAWLIGGKKARIHLPKAGVIVLRVRGPFEKGCAELRELLTPPGAG